MTAPQQENREPSRFRLTRLRIVVLVLIALSLLARITLPSILTPLLEDAGSSFLGVPVTIGNLDLALLSGIFVIEDLKVGGVAVGGEPAPDDLLRLERFTLRIRWLSSLGDRIDIRRIRLTGPRVRLRTLGDGRLDASLLGQGVGQGDGETEAESDPTPEPDSEPTRITIHHLVLTDLDFEFRDASIEPFTPLSVRVGAFTLDEVAVVAESIEIGSLEIEHGRVSLAGEAPLGLAFEGGAEQISYPSGSPSPVRIAIAITQPESDGENPSIGIEGNVAIEPLSFDGRLEVAALPLPVLVAPVDLGPAGNWLRSGTASGMLAIAVQPNSDGGQDLRFGGKLVIADFNFTNSLDDEEREIGFAWKSLEVELNEGLVNLDANGTSISPPTIHLSEISLDGPRVKFTQPSEAFALLLGAEPEAEATPAEEPESAAPPPSVRIDRVKIEDGRLDFIDHSTTPSFSGRFDKLEFEASQIDSIAETAERLELSLASGDGTLEIKGSLGEKPELTLEIDELELGPFNAYALTHAGYVIDRGKLSLHSVVRREDGLFKADNEIILHDLDMQDAGGSGFQDQFGVSLSLGLALLRDVDGDITIEVPIESSLTETEFQLAPVVLDALRSAFMGAITSPLKMFNAAMSNDDTDTREKLIPCEPEDDDFTEAGEEQIAQLAELLIEHPTLAVSMGGQVGPLDQDSDEFVPGDGRLDELAHDRAERLNEILSVKFEVDPEQLRIDPQIHVGDPGVAIELVPR